MKNANPIRIMPRITSPIPTIPVTLEIANPAAAGLVVPGEKRTKTTPEINEIAPIIIIANNAISSAKKNEEGFRGEEFSDLFYFGSFVFQTPFRRVAVKFKRDAQESAYKSLIEKFKSATSIKICPNCRREVFGFDLNVTEDCCFCDKPDIRKVSS